MSDERALIRRCKQGDESAFAELVALKRQRVFRIALNIIGPEDDAKDISQLAFVRLWRGIGSFDESGRFDPWFFRIVVHLAIDHWRRARRGPDLAGAGEIDSATPASAGGSVPGTPASEQERAVYRADIRRIFNEAALRLTPLQRAAFTLREIEGLSTEDVAGAMGVRASTVRNHLMQARKILQDWLRRRYPEIAGDR